MSPPCCAPRLSHPLRFPSDPQQLPALPAEARSSIPTEEPKGPKAGKKPETQVKGNSSPCAVARGAFVLLLPCRGAGAWRFPAPGRRSPRAARLGWRAWDGEGPRGFLFNAML